LIPQFLFHPADAHKPTHASEAFVGGDPLARAAAHAAAGVGGPPSPAVGEKLTVHPAMCSWKPANIAPIAGIAGGWAGGYPCLGGTKLDGNGIACPGIADTVASAAVVGKAGAGGGGPSGRCAAGAWLADEGGDGNAGIGPGIGASDLGTSALSGGSYRTGRGTGGPAGPSLGAGGPLSRGGGPHALSSLLLGPHRSDMSELSSSSLAMLSSSRPVLDLERALGAEGPDALAFPLAPAPDLPFGGTALGRELSGALLSPGWRSSRHVLMQGCTHAEVQTWLTC